jgi:hypothetical protein
MILNEEITIKVPVEIAEAYRNSSEESRQQMELKIRFILEDSIKNQKERVEKLKKTMDSMSQEAQLNGLTPEILESILREDE